MGLSWVGLLSAALSWAGLLSAALLSVDLLSVVLGAEVLLAEQLLSGLADRLLAVVVLPWAALVVRLA